MSGVSARKRIFGWMMFDWASQPYATLILTFVFGPYFAAIVADSLMGEGLSEQAADARAQSLWSLGQTIAGVIIAFSAPVLGAMADAAGRRMPWIWAFSAVYVLGASALWWTYPDASNATLMLIAFGIGLIGMEFTIIFTNALLPDLGTESEVGAISGSGFALGYAGGVVSLVIMLLFFVEQANGTTLIGLEPALGLDAAAREGTRFVGPFTALWFVVFMVFFFAWVKEPAQPRRGVPVGHSLRQLKTTLLSLPLRRSLAAYLGSSLMYRDALNGLYGFGGVYAALVLDWSITQIGVFGIVGAITATVVSWIGGRADRAFGPKPVIAACIATLLIVCVTIVALSREAFFGVTLAPGSPLPDVVFYICGAVIGGAGGALQAASRSMMVRHAAPDRPTEAFGLYALSGKATAFLAPLLIYVATEATGSARLGVSPLILLFLIGLILLLWVDPEGDRT